MGAHGTVEDALSNIAAFNAAAAQKARQDKKASRESKKAAKEKSKKHKHKKSSKRKRDDSSDSDSDQGPISATEQITRSQAAVRSLREILERHGEVRRDLRLLLWKLDNGEAVDVSGIPDPALLAKLRILFGHLLFNQTSEDVALKGPRSLSALALLSPIFEEVPARPSTTGPAPAPAPAPAAKPSVPTSAPESAPSATAPGSAAAAAAASAPASSAAVPAMQQAPDQASHSSGPGAAAPADPLNARLTTSSLVAAEIPTQGEPAEASLVAPAIGPAMPPDLPDDLSQAETSGQEAVEAALQKPRVGPAMPPRELLDAAAEVAREMALDDEDDLLVGPAPPELSAEDELASADDRSREVLRITSVMDAAKDAAPDAYVLLGVDPTASAGEIKKRFWKLSLLVHPDKCRHSRAKDAFDVVSRTAKSLQDVSERAAIDKGRQEAAGLVEARAQAAEEERARQWRVVRGQATAEDLKGPARAPGAKEERGDWMTQLPPERRPNTGPPSQKSQTAFAMRGVQVRGDASAWTDTPQEKLLRLQRGYEASALQAAPRAGAGDEAASQAVKDFNAQHRGKSLVEQHQAKLKEQQKAARKAKKSAKSGTAPEPATAAAPSYDTAKHPWRPFDRDKDLGQGPRLAKGPVQGAGSLSDRFG